MNYLKLFLFTIITSATLLLTQTSALAAALPMSGVLIFVKSIASKQVVASNTDDSGNFNVQVRESSGAFDVFIGDESIPPVKINAKNGVVSGRVVILTDGTTTKDPVPVPVPVKKPIPVKTIPKPVTKTTK